MWGYIRHKKIHFLLKNEKKRIQIILPTKKLNDENYLCDRRSSLWNWKMNYRCKYRCNPQIGWVSDFYAKI
jgi:hypothetical protein